MIWIKHSKALLRKDYWHARELSKCVRLVRRAEFACYLFWFFFFYSLFLAACCKTRVLLLCCVWCGVCRVCWWLLRAYVRRGGWRNFRKLTSERLKNHYSKGDRGVLETKRAQDPAHTAAPRARFVARFWTFLLLASSSVRPSGGRLLLGSRVCICAGCPEKNFLERSGETSPSWNSRDEVELFRVRPRRACNRRAEELPSIRGARPSSARVNETQTIFFARGFVSVFLILSYLQFATSRANYCRS